MEERDLIVVGAGVSGLTLAWHARRAGLTPLVLEAEARVGGCLDSRRLPSGYWYELGAHTCYNSYSGLLEILEGTGAMGKIVARGEARKRFALLDGGRLTTMGPLSVFRQFGAWELMASAPRGLLAGKQGRTTRDYYAGVVGSRNYRRVLAPFLSAVPSQNVDDFPAEGPGSLFKRRPRRKDVIKSFTLDGGLSVVADAVMASGVEVRTSAPVRDIARAGADFSVRTDAGGLTSARLALACPPSVTAALLGPIFPELARVVGRIASARVETLGVAVRREATELPELAFVVPASDIFWSAVTRDPVPDPAWRGFAFHFRPGHTRAERLSRVSQVLGVSESDFADLSERMTTLPAPTVGHAGVVAEIDRLLAGSRLSLTGNYFAGLAIEDCVLRSRAEWRRLAALDPVAGRGRSGPRLPRR